MSVKKFILLLIAAAIIFVTAFSAFTIDSIKTIVGSKEDNILIAIRQFYAKSELVFCLIITMLALALGLAMVSFADSVLDIPYLSRFMIGIGAAPFIIALLMFLNAAILPGGSATWFILCPLLAAGLLIWRYQRNMGLVIEEMRAAVEKVNLKLPLAIGMVCVMVLFGKYCAHLVVNGKGPVNFQDTNVYRSQALPFAEERSLDAIIPFNGSPEGNIPRATHNFVFPAYLSYAMLVSSKNGVYGYPYDQAVNDAYKILMAFLVLAIAGLSWMDKDPFMPVVACLLFFSIAEIDRINAYVTRDAFRMLPLIGLANILAGLRMRRMSSFLQAARASLLVGLWSYFCLGGHTLGGVFAVLIFLAWLAWTLIARQFSFYKVLVVGMSGAVGLLIGAGKYLQTFVNYGEIRYVEGLDYVQQSMPSVQAARANFFSGLLERIAWNELFTKQIENPDVARIILPALIACLLLVVYSLVRKKMDDQKIFLVISMVLLVGFFMFKYRINTGGSFSNMLINPRYKLHIYPFALVVLVHFVINMLNTCAKWLKTHSVLNTLLASLLLVSLSIYSYSILDEWHSQKWYSTLTRYNKTIRVAKEILAERGGDGKVLTAYTSWPYYFNNRNVQLLRHPASLAIRTSQSEEDLLQNLKEAKIIMAAYPSNARNLIVNTLRQEAHSKVAAEYLDTVVYLVND